MPHQPSVQRSVRRSFLGFCALAALISVVPGGLSAQQRRPGPARQDPQVLAAQAARSTLAHARTALVVNHLDSSAGVSNDREFRDLRADLVRWNRFKIAEGSRLADVTVTFGPAYSATIRRRDTGALLWSGSGDTWASLMSKMKKDVPPHAPTVCVAFWCR